MTHPMVELINRIREQQPQIETKPVERVNAPPLPDSGPKLRNQLKYLLDRYGERSYEYVNYCIEQKYRTDWWNDFFTKETK